MARFLVVDDDHASVRALARLLTDDGHDVASFTAGADAVAALRRESFDAVVTDREMPHVDGRAVVQAIREHHPSACVVVVSETPERVEQERDDRVCMIADKPLDYDSITKHIGDCRARGGPGVHGRCHLRAHLSRLTPPASLRRK